MEADTIRLILIVVGVAAILALYLWERSRDRAEDDEEDYDDEEPMDAVREKREPNLGELHQHGAPGSAGMGSPMEREYGTESDWDPDEDEDAADDSGEPKPLLIQLSVVTRNKEFEGPAILDVAETCGLRPGDMNIFHCLDQFDEGTRVYFSMANMVKPGTFPFDAMEDFSTPGLMLFAQLEGDTEDLTILDEMTATARKLANVLGGDVLDDTRRALTVRKEEALRAAVLENERRWGKVTQR